MDCVDTEIQNNKFTLCVKRTQHGKTFTTIESIKNQIDNDYEYGRSFHIVFTMNTLLSNKQFSKRLENIEDEYGEGSVCVFASRYDGNYSHVKSLLELKGMCMDMNTCPRVIVACNNTIRYDDIVSFIETLQKNKYFDGRIFCYFDELHKYISDKLRSQIEMIHEMNVVEGILALTATPDNIFKESGFWSKLRMMVIDLDNLDDSNYIGYSDMLFECIDDYFPEKYVRPRKFDYDSLDEDTIGFITHVLKKHHSILSSGSRCFIPAHIRRISHNTVRDLIFSLNRECVVIVINGYEKTLQYRDKHDYTNTIILESNDEEVCETISNIIVRYGLKDRSMVITGFLCIGMGQTLAHKSIGSFTHAIFGHMDLTNDELYQLFGRITGRMKTWDTYVQTQVYCPSVIMQRCFTMEKCAKKIGEDFNGKFAGQDEYRLPMLDSDGYAAHENIRPKKTTKPRIKTDANDRLHKVFDFQSDAIEFANTLGVHFRKRDEHSCPETLCKDGMFPTVEYIIERFWGINKQSKVRMIPSIDHKWVVYWNPTLL